MYCILCNKPTKEQNMSKQTVHKLCQLSYHEHVTQLINIKMCSMCGTKTRKLTNNTCNKCLNSCF